MLPITAAWAAGTAYEFVIEDYANELVGRVSLTSVIRGRFQNAYLGYFVRPVGQRARLRDRSSPSRAQLRIHGAQRENAETCEPKAHRSRRVDPFMETAPAKKARLFSAPV